MAKFKTLELSVQEADFSVRWRLFPANKFTRFFWGWINVEVEIDYLQLSKTRERLKDD